MCKGESFVDFLEVCGELFHFVELHGGEVVLLEEEHFLLFPLVLFVGEFFAGTDELLLELEDGGGTEFLGRHAGEYELINCRIHNEILLLLLRGGRG